MALSQSSVILVSAASQGCLVRKPDCVGDKSYSPEKKLYRKHGKVIDVITILSVNLTFSNCHLPSINNDAMSAIHYKVLEKYIKESNIFFFTFMIHRFASV